MTRIAWYALALALLSSSLVAAERRLFRWVDVEGRVHYTDALPAEAIDKARQELSLVTGLVTGEVGRALTAEERRRAETEAVTVATRRQREENLRRSDEAKVASFTSEEELRAAYRQRGVMIEETLDALRAAIDAQRTSLGQQLAVAGEAELAGRPVPERTRLAIQELRRELLRQQQFIVERSAERHALEEELERLVRLFHERRERGLAATGDGGQAAD